jgi:hypothetical protein
MDTFAKAGIMIRNSSNDDASAIVLDVRPGGQIEFMSRPSTGADMVFLGTANVTFPVWLQLDWRGTSASKTVVASYSQDHVQWQLIGAPLTYAFPNAFDVGIVATSHDSTVTAAAHFTGLSVLPSNEWGDDIGATGIVGNASVDQMSPGGATTVEAAGADIWGTADSFYFVHQPQSPGQVMTSIRADVRATQPFAKAGLIVRDGLAPDAPTVILDVKPDGGIEFMARMCAGCPATFIAGTQIGVPARLRLSRDDNGMFSASVLSDDLSQTVNLGSVTVPMASPEGGYAVTSHDTTRLARGIFDDPPH